MIRNHGAIPLIDKVTGSNTLSLTDYISSHFIRMTQQKDDGSIVIVTRRQLVNPNHLNVEFRSIDLIVTEKLHRSGDGY